MYAVDTTDFQMNFFNREIMWRIMLEKSDIKKAYLWQHR